MNLARNVRIDVENPFFTTSRFVAAPAELTVGEMMIIVHAALGLEPSHPGILVDGDDTPIDVLSIIDQDFFETFREVAHYHPSDGAWNISISVADSSRVVMGLPALIAGEGPDLMSELGNAEAMFKVVLDVQATMAYMAVPTESMERIFALFPNYTLDQIHQRLTTFFPPAVAQRLATMGTEAANLEGGTKPALPGDLPLDPFRSTPFEDIPVPSPEMLKQWRADIHEAYPELRPDYELPALNDAIAAHVGQRIREYLEVIEEFPRLTGAGYLKQAAVARLKEGLNSPNDFEDVKREDYHQPLLNLRGFLTDLDWIKTTTTDIKLTKYGRKAMSDPLWATQVVLNNIPYAYAEPEGIPQLSFELVHLFRGEWEFNPEYDYTHAITRDLLFTLGILEDDSTFPDITDGCEGFLGEIITKVREELNQELG